MNRIEYAKNVGSQGSICSEMYYSKAGTPHNQLQQGKSGESVARQSISMEYPVLEDNMNRYQALFVACNLILGLGPIILPNALLQVGLLFGLTFIMGIALLAYLSAEFIVETIGICNFMQVNSSFSDRRIITGVIPAASAGTSGGIMHINNNNNMRHQNEIERDFRMEQKFELAEIAGALFGKEAQIVVSVAVVVFLMGATVAKGIAIARILSTTFAGISVVDSFLLWVVVIFAFGATFSFKNVSHFAWVQEYVALIRLFILYAIMIGCAFEVYRSGYKGIVFEPEYPLVNLGNFQNFFSTAVLSFLFHHSIPAFVKPITPQKHVRWVLRATFLIAMLVFAAVSYSGVVAFGPDLASHKGEVNFISDNFKSNEFALYYLSALYIFLIVIAFPIITITCRNTLMKLLAPNKIPEISSEITPHTFVFTMTIILSIAIACVLATNVQSVLNFMGGTIGIMLLFIVPSVYVIVARHQLKTEFGIDYKLNRYVTSISSPILPYFVGTVGLIALMYSSYNLTK